MFPLKNNLKKTMNQIAVWVPCRPEIVMTLEIYFTSFEGKEMLLFFSVDQKWSHSGMSTEFRKGQLIISWTD